MTCWRTTRSFWTWRQQRDDVPGWDSFNYIKFIVAVEMELGVKFRVADVESFENRRRTSSAEAQALQN